MNRDQYGPPPRRPRPHQGPPPRTAVMPPLPLQRPDERRPGPRGPRPRPGRRQGPPPRPPRPPRRPHWGRRLKAVLIIVVLAVAALGIYVDTQLTRVDAIERYDGRPGPTDGTNWLIVGSDSRADLTSQQEQRLSTGSVAGQRTDTIMLLHSGSAPTTLVSLPRDSFVSIPGQGRDKLNAAFAIGGPSLLIRTVEQATGLRIDHYAEVGFGGFVDVVDAVGGVDMCVPQSIRDPKAGLNIKKGCQELDGETALAYVRTRATLAADLARIERQRAFLAALMERVAGPATLLNPFRMVPLVQAIPGALSVDTGDHVWHLVGLAWAMRELSGGNGVTTTVPISGLDSVGGSSVVRWDSDRAKRLFAALAEDEPVPRGALG